MDLAKLSLESIGDGALVELFEYELDRVLMNIADVNADSKEARKIRIDLTFTPSKDRGSAEVGVKVNSKLAGTRQHNATIFINREGGLPVAYVRNPNQQEMNLQAIEPVADQAAEGGGAE